MNTPEQNIVNTLKGKKVVILENDNIIDDERLQEFVKILEANGIEYEAICDLTTVANYDINDIIEPVMKADAIVFMTQWVYEISKTMREFIADIQKKIIIEVYIGDPTWYYAKQHGTHHDVYIYTCRKYWDSPKESESFYKLSDEPYWSYKNKFDL